MLERRMTSLAHRWCAGKDSQSRSAPLDFFVADPRQRL
jgi:hypothetical protein